MKKIAMMRNPVQHYAWGSTTALPSLLQTGNPSGTPYAELWMGAHPKAPSEIDVDNRWISLMDLIEMDPVAVLGREVAARFDSRLPYLFKVLAIARPLSVQAHPDRAGAIRGFEEENRLGIPLDAPNRNYRDPSHKPECICALTPLTALNGFRFIPDIISYMDRICPAVLSEDLEDLRKHPDSRGLKAFFQRLMTLDAGARIDAIAQGIEKATKRTGEDPAFEWMVRLHDAYPDDMGIFAPMLLNLVVLDPGRAMFLPAGELHAYLSGMGIELMANSDNVLRGGLTPKHIDVPELLRVLTFAERQVDVLVPDRISVVESVFRTHAQEFVLSVIRIEASGAEAVFEPRGMEILICTQGWGKFISLDEPGLEIIADQGTSVLVTASAGKYRISGDATFYKASVPV